jgi:hypothetical protein
MSLDVLIKEINLILKDMSQNSMHTGTQMPPPSERDPPAHTHTHDSSVTLRWVSSSAAPAYCCISIALMLLHSVRMLLQV